MGIFIKDTEYAKKHFNEVHHTTLNPEGPGVVRIHLVPPKIKDGEVGASIAIINGQDVIPVNTAWSILLTELIEEINKYAGKPITDDDAKQIVKATCKSVKKVYPIVSRARLKKDIYRIMNTFKQVARGEKLDEDVAYMTLGDYASSMRAPHRMDLLVSAMTVDGKWNCNQNCVHCYASGQKRAEEHEMPTDKWFKILDKCRQVGIPQVTFTGGEPTMRDDLIKLIAHAKWFVTRLNTNGIKLTKEYCKQLKEAELDSMQITFYSFDEEVHNKLVGAPKYADTVAGIENALEAGINLSINTPLCTLNRNYVDTLRFLHEKGVIYVTCSGLITTGNAAKEESESLQLTPTDLRAILKESVEYCYANGMEISFTSPGWVDDKFCKELGINTPNCGACLSNMAITPSGKVVPCQSWLSDEPLGDFLKDEWKKIWSSDVCKKRRNYSAFMRCDCPLRIRKNGKVQKAGEAK